MVRGGVFLAAVDVIVVDACWNGAFLIVTVCVTNVAGLVVPRCVLSRKFTTAFLFKKIFSRCSITLVPSSWGRNFFTTSCITMSRMNALCQTTRENIRCATAATPAVP